MKPLVPMNRKTLYVRLGALTVILTAALFAATTNGCNQGAEGDRCNPNLVSTNPSPSYNEDECGSGLTCQSPSFCPENYCCPPTAARVPTPTASPGATAARPLAAPPATRPTAPSSTAVRTESVPHAGAAGVRPDCTPALPTLLPRQAPTLHLPPWRAPSGASPRRR